jgi:hypothetical protein
VTSAIHSVLLECIGEVCRVPSPMWLQELVKWWEDNGAQVISLNYDPLVERAFCEFAGTGGVGTLYATPLTPIEWRYGDAMWALDRPRSKIRFYKLHGSITWMFSGSEAAAGETIYYWGDQDQWDTPILRELPADKVPLLLPPVANKGSLFHHEVIRSIWIKAAKAAQQAKRVFVLGYSLPPSDELMRTFLFTNAPKGQRKMYIADVNSDAEFAFRRRLESRYAIQQIAGREPIPSLVNALKSGQLR